MAAMGFYYNPNSEPPDEEPPGTFKEAAVITWVVFRALALPLALLIGAVIGIFAIFWLFFIQPLIVVGLIVIGVVALIARGIWEARHPPQLR